MQRFVQWGAWSLLGSVLAFLFAIDMAFVIREGAREARAETGTQSHANQQSHVNQIVNESHDNDRKSVRGVMPFAVASTESAPVQWVEWKRAWLRYHRHVLPIAVATFFLSFGLWSLLAVENLAIRPQSSS